MKQILFMKRNKSIEAMKKEGTMKKVSSQPSLLSDHNTKQFKSIPAKNFDCANLSPFVQQLTGRNNLKGHIGRQSGSYRSLQFLRPIQERESA
jgi:hypothetical protein